MLSRERIAKLWAEAEECLPRNSQMQFPMDREVAFARLVAAAELENAVKSGTVDVPVPEAVSTDPRFAYGAGAMWACSAFRDLLQARARKNRKAAE